MKPLRRVGSVKFLREQLGQPLLVINIPGAMASLNWYRAVVGAFPARRGGSPLMLVRDWHGQQKQVFGSHAAQAALSQVFA